MDIITFISEYTEDFLQQSQTERDIYFGGESYILLPYERYRGILGKDILECLPAEDEIVVYTNQGLSSRVVEKLRSQGIEVLDVFVLDELLNIANRYAEGINVPATGCSMFKSILASRIKVYMMEHNMTRMKRSVWFDYD